MANPIIGSPDAFTRHGSAPAQPYPQAPGSHPGQAFDPYQQQSYDPYQQPVSTGAVMTLDDVLAKTAVTLGVVAAVAALTFLFLPPQLLTPVWIVAALGGLVTVMIVSRQQRISVPGVLLYAVIEGVFVGAISSFFNYAFPGIIAPAVMATFITAGVTLAAYKFFNIRVTPKFRKVVFIGTASLAIAYLANLVLSLFGVRTGLVEVGPNAGLLAIGVSILAVVLAVLSLITDFDAVERGIAMRAPAQESWRAALGITVTMVWLYMEILRILSYFRN